MVLTSLMSKYMMEKSDSNIAVISPFITLPEAVKATHCPRSTILKYSRLGRFPQVIRLLGDRIAFNRADVQDWIETRLEASKEAM
jgi:predicted DNA-binding transcriptional regulator AlpA